MSAIDSAASLPQLDGELRLPGLHGSVTLRRDAFGIGHVDAQNEHDAWFGQGVVAAQDRLWQMEFDRLRGQGRWAEAAGPYAVPADTLARRMQLSRAAKEDVSAMCAGTLAMFTAFAEGVNAYINSGQPLPIEYILTGIKPDRWEAWHSVLAFKVRHVHMGAWQGKINNAKLLVMAGAEALAKLPPGGTPPDSSLILPPGAKYQAMLQQASLDLAELSKHLDFLGDGEGGSNSWAVHGSRTTTGMPVLCNDSHRALDVPNAYWQVHVSCPEFNVTGATFPSMPGFPHFGHNGSVAWSITHTQSDYQDLYIEQFDPAVPGRYLTIDGWKQAEMATETIAVRGGEPVTIETYRTGHGPIIFGDPRSGWALSFRYTATDGPTPAFESLRPMLQARTVADLHATQRDWVDPVNNLVSADTQGNIGYLVRGRIPVRTSAAGRRHPVPGWDGACEWTGFVPFEQLPQAINPPEGFIATANQRVIQSDEPYIGTSYASPSRADRIAERIMAKAKHTPSEIMDIQDDTVSIPARTWAGLLRRVGPFQGDAEACRARLAAWDADLLPESPEAAAYAHFRRAISRAMFEPIVGQKAWAWITSDENAALGRVPGAWLASMLARLDSEYRDVAPGGRPWAEILPPALEQAWRMSNGTTQRWDECHGTASKHPLTPLFPEHAALLDQPATPYGGDGDTIKCAAYGWSNPEYVVAGTSVYRQAVDLADIEHASSIIPGGASGRPGSPHYADQVEHWRTATRIPMHWTPQDVEAGAVHTLVIRA